MTIGLIIHGDSAWTGHGPGVLDLLSSRTGRDRHGSDPDANIAWRMGLRTAPSEHGARAGRRRQLVRRHQH